MTTPSSTGWRHGRLPAEVRTALSASLRAEGRTKGRVLAWASTPDGFCVGTTGTLSYQTNREWRHIGWHEIDEGGWNSETARLEWRLHSGRRDSLTLLAPGRLPEVFRERVAASIVLQRQVPIAHGGSVIISARRDLSNSQARLEWHRKPARGTTWRTPGVEEASEAALSALRAEYGPF